MGAGAKQEIPPRALYSGPGRGQPGIKSAIPSREVAPGKPVIEGAAAAGAKALFPGRSPSLTPLPGTTVDPRPRAALATRAQLVGLVLRSPRLAGYGHVGTMNHPPEPSRESPRTGADAPASGADRLPFQYRSDRGSKPHKAPNSELKGGLNGNRPPLPRLGPPELGPRKAKTRRAEGSSLLPTENASGLAWSLLTAPMFFDVSELG